MLRGKNYCITRENLMMHEMIGLKVKVGRSTDRGRDNMNGKIVDETKNTFIIATAKGEKVVPKNTAALEFMLGDERVMVEGANINYRPEDRIKACMRRGF